MSNVVENRLFTVSEMVRLGLHVPEMLRDLEKALGVEAVWTLTGACDGCECGIPQKSRMSRSVVTRRLGKEIVTWLFETYNYGNIVIPMGAHGSRALRLSTFLTALEAGKSHSQIAKENGCHTRTVERIKRRLLDAGFLQL